MFDITYHHVNGIKVAAHDTGGDGTPLILAHGLTANMHNFTGLLRAGLAENQRVVLLDLRGRGLTDKPDTGYHMRDHMADVVQLADALGIDRFIMGGHSFGGLLTMYMGANMPQRIEKMIIMDAGKEATHESVLPAIKPSLDRLGQVIPSLEDYLNIVRNAPYFTEFGWHDDLETYYRADVETVPGGVRSRVSAPAIEEAIRHIISMDWDQIIRSSTPPALLIHAQDPLGAAPVLSPEGAQETVELLPDCQYAAVPGNHITMVMGDYAPEVVRIMREFIED